MLVLLEKLDPFVLCQEIWSLANKLRLEVVLYSIDALSLNDRSWICHSWSCYLGQTHSGVTSQLGVRSWCVPPWSIELPSASNIATASYFFFLTALSHLFCKLYIYNFILLYLPVLKISGMHHCLAFLVRDDATCEVINRSCGTEGSLKRKDNPPETGV